MAQPKTAEATDRPSSKELEEELRTLELRLRKGEEQIRHGRETGADAELVNRWEDHWIGLLRQYELKLNRAQRVANAERQRSAAGGRDT